MYAIVRASVSACSKLALGWRRTAARQTSPSMSSPRGLASTRWRTTWSSSAWRSRFSLSRLIRRSSMFAPRKQDLGREDCGTHDLGWPVERLADPHRNDGLALRFIQVGGSPAQLLFDLGPERGRRRHQRLHGVGGLLRGALVEPAPGTVLPLGLREPLVGRHAEIGCRRGEREDGVGGGIEGGSMPLVDPVIAVYARITQVLDDLLLNDVLAGEGRGSLEDFEDVGIRRYRGVTLEREGKEEIHALEWPERPSRDRETVPMQDTEGQRRVVRVGPQSFHGHADSVVGERLRKVAHQRLRLDRTVVGAGQVVQRPGDLEDLEGRDRRQAAVTPVAQQHGDVFVRLLVARLEEEIRGGRGRVGEGAVGGELLAGGLDVEPVAQVLDRVQQRRLHVVDEPWRDMADLGAALRGNTHETLEGEGQLTKLGRVEHGWQNEFEAGEVRAGLPVAGVLVDEAQRLHPRAVSSAVLEVLRQVRQRDERAQGRDQLVLGDLQRRPEAAVGVLAAQQP